MLSQSTPRKNGWLLKSSAPLLPSRTLGSQISLEGREGEGGWREGGIERWRREDRKEKERREG